jgi:hypothetical protein
MDGLLVRVAADQCDGDGSWNGPVDSRTREFVYVAIPEYSETHRSLNKPFAALSTSLGAFDCAVPAHLAPRNMHLDPDFDYLTYGDQGERAKQISTKLGTGDHMLPHARGGTSDLSNMIVTCAPCNNGRSNLTLEEVGLADPFLRAPVRSTWDGLERFRSAIPKLLPSQ